MMKDNLAVVYFSKHGMTEKYARWIAEEVERSTYRREKSQRRRIA